MNLPNPQVVKRLTEHLGTMAATVVVMFGLQAKGVDPAKVTALINSMGDLVNTLVIVVGAIGGFVALFRSMGSSTTNGATQQFTQLVTANPAGSASVLTPENKVALAQATVAVAANSDTTNRALLEAAEHGLDNVKGIVTDERTALGTVNPNIVSDPNQIH